MKIHWEWGVLMCPILAVGVLHPHHWHSIALVFVLSCVCMLNKGHETCELLTGILLSLSMTSACGYMNIPNIDDTILKITLMTSLAAVYLISVGCTYHHSPMLSLTAHIGYYLGISI